MISKQYLLRFSITITYIGRCNLLTQKASVAFEQGEILSSSVSTSKRIIIKRIKLHHSKVNMGFDSYLFEITKETSYTTILVYSVAVSAGSFVLYAYSVFQLWEKEFSGNRLDRSSMSSPSNKQPPKVER